MSYLLIDGQRYYKDDRTGRIIRDNVSQLEADRRALRNQGILGTSGELWSSPVTRNRTGRMTSNSNSDIYSSVHTEFPWKAVIVGTEIVLFIVELFLFL